MSWICSEAFKWTMDCVIRACAYYLCKIQGFPDTESRSNVPNFQRKRVKNGKEGLFRSGVWATQPRRSGRQLERAIKWFPEKQDNFSSLIIMQEVRITSQNESVRTVSCFLNLQGTPTVLHHWLHFLKESCCYARCTSKKYSSICLFFWSISMIFPVLLATLLHSLSEVVLFLHLFSLEIK